MDRPAQEAEIVVTEEMVEAGASVLKTYAPHGLNERDLAVEVFEAMFAIHGRIRSSG